MARKAPPRSKRRRAPKKGRARPNGSNGSNGEGSDPPPEIDALGPPPDDPLEAQAYMYKLLVLSAADVARDRNISAADRRKELRTIIAAAGKVMPRARLYRAEQLVLASRAELEQRARERQGARIEPLPPRPATETPTTAPANDGEAKPSDQS